MNFFKGFYTGRGRRCNEADRPRLVNSHCFTLAAAALWRQRHKWRTQANWKLVQAGGLILLLVATGCTTKSTAKAQARAAFLAGQQQAHMQQQQGPVVTVLGQVRNRTVPWSEELTLNKALIAAEYQGFKDPRSIIINRNGQQYKINIRQLLKGREDPPLEPGDTVEVQ